MRITKYIITLLLIITSSCNVDEKEAEKKLADDSVRCGMAYTTSDLYFTDADVLKFNIRFIYFADSITEKVPDYGYIIQSINKFFASSKIQFVPYTGSGGFERKVVNSDIKKDMPSFIKYHLNMFKNDSTITMYIYGDEQPNYSSDMKNITGSAGGIGSNFFAVKFSYIYESTVLHELGHCFFLMHTTEYDPTEKGLSLQYGDKICDLIKADPTDMLKNDTCYVETGWNVYSKEEINRVICNIMSYSYLNCRKCITNVQKSRMRFYVHESPTMRMALSK